MAQEVPPYQRLSPDSQPWGRWVTDKIQKNEVAQDSALSNLRSQNQNLAAQLNRLQLQVSALDGVINQQNELLANQVFPVVSNSSNSGFSLTTSEQTVASLSITPPPDYTRVAVIAVGSVTGMSSGSGDRMFSRCNIDGAAGPTSTSVMAISTPWMPGSSSSSRIFPVGGAFTVALGAWLQAGPGGSTLTNATLTVSATFLR